MPTTTQGPFTLQGFESPEEVLERIGRVQAEAQSQRGFDVARLGSEGAILAAAFGGTITPKTDPTTHPSVKKAQRRQSLLQGVDTSTYEGLLQGAKVAQEGGDSALSLTLMNQAEKMKPKNILEMVGGYGELAVLCKQGNQHACSILKSVGIGKEGRKGKPTNIAPPAGTAKERRSNVDEFMDSRDIVIGDNTFDLAELQNADDYKNLLSNSAAALSTFAGKQGLATISHRMGIEIIQEIMEKAGAFESDALDIPLLGKTTLFGRRDLKVNKKKFNSVMREIQQKLTKGKIPEIFKLSPTAQSILPTEPSEATVSDVAKQQHLSDAQQALRDGADPEKVKSRLKELGVDPSELK